VVVEAWDGRIWRELNALSDTHWRRRETAGS
jgi:hypothetical protein